MRAWGRRNPPGMFAPWKQDATGVLDAYEVTEGCTGFRNMDALGPDVIFWGFVLGNNKQEWIMKVLSKD